jgi:hypothetical protein
VSASPANADGVASRHPASTPMLSDLRHLVAIVVAAAVTFARKG